MAQTRKIIKKITRRIAKVKIRQRKQTVEQPQQCNSQQKSSANGNSNNKMRKKEKEQMPAYSGPNWEYEFERFLKIEQK